MVILQNPLLIAFERVVALKTIHAAALDLGLTQVAITKRIQALERELGVGLFLRSRRGMALTDEGRALLQFCKVAQEAEGELLGKIKGTGRQEASLTLVGPSSAISTRIVENCAPLYAKHPFLRLHLRSDDHSNLIETVRRGEADLAVVPPEQVPNEMVSKVLKPDRYMLVATRRWRGRELTDILTKERIIDFHEADPTTTNYLKKFGLNAQAPRSRLFVNENDALTRLICEGVGFGTLTENVARPFIDDGRLIRLNRGQSMESRLALAWFARPKTLPHFFDLLHSIK
jgi:LysR family transcriptional regulator (chromosome initiation inhibitor)